MNTPTRTHIAVITSLLGGTGSFLTLLLAGSVRLYPDLFFPASLTLALSLSLLVLSLPLWALLHTYTLHSDKSLPTPDTNRVLIRSNLCSLATFGAGFLLILLSPPDLLRLLGNTLYGTGTAILLFTTTRFLWHHHMTGSETP